jgi:hypothetical protein
MASAVQGTFYDVDVSSGWGKGIAAAHDSCDPAVTGPMLLSVSHSPERS